MSTADYTHAIIFGASGGIGAALCHALPATRVTALSRRGGDFDVTNEASIAAALHQAGPADLVIDATGALEIDGVAPEKSLDALNPANMARHFAVNAIGPALILKHAIPSLPRKGRVVVVSLSARVGSIGDNRLGGWISYRASKAALNQIIRTASIEMTRRNPQSICVALHPGTVRTSLTRRYAGRHAVVSPDQSAQNLVAVMGGLSPDQTGGFFDWQGLPVPW